MLLSSCSERNPIGRRTETDRTANGIRSDGERNPIGRRTETDRTADGNRSDGGRKPIGRRTETVGGAAVSAAPTKQTGNLLQLSPLHQPSQQNNLFLLSSLGFAACQSKSCTNQANATNVGGYVILAVVTQSSIQISFH